MIGIFSINIITENKKKNQLMNIECMSNTEYQPVGLIAMTRSRSESKLLFTNMLLFMFCGHPVTTYCMNRAPFKFSVEALVRPKPNLDLVNMNKVH